MAAAPRLPQVRLPKFSGSVSTVSSDSVSKFKVPSPSPTAITTNMPNMMGGGLGAVAPMLQTGVMNYGRFAGQMAGMRLGKKGSQPVYMSEKQDRTGLGPSGGPSLVHKPRESRGFKLASLAILAKASTESRAPSADDIVKTPKQQAQKIIIRKKTITRPTPQFQAGLYLGRAAVMGGKPGEAAGTIGETVRSGSFAAAYYGRRPKTAIKVKNV